MRRTLAGLILFLGSTAVWPAPVTAWLTGPPGLIQVGDIFSVVIHAAIPDPVDGWGLDLTYDTDLLLLLGSPIIGANWMEAFAPDGDGLLGLAPFLSPVSGTDLLLASLRFQALAAGITGLALGVTPDDYAEGFPLSYPADPGSFAELVVQGLSVSVVSAAVPVPPVTSLLLLGLAALVRRRR